LTLNSGKYPLKDYILIHELIGIKILKISLMIKVDYCPLTSAFTTTP